MRPPWWGRRNASRIGCRRGRTAPRETALAPCCWAAPALKRCASLPKPCCKACHAKVGSRARPHSISTAAAGVAGAVCALHLLPPACGAIRQPIGVADVIVAGLALIAVVPTIAPALLAPATPLGDALEALARLLKGELAAEGSALRSSCAAAQAKGNEKGNGPSLVGHEQLLRAKTRGFRAAGRLTSFSLPRAHMPVTVALRPPRLPQISILCSVCRRAARAQAIFSAGRQAPATGRPMREILFFMLSSFWAGAAHAATPGHGKTIAAAYIVGARGRPIDAVILGVFVTLSHTSGILLVGVLASLGFGWLHPQRIEAYLALGVGILVIVLGLWMLFTQRDLLALAMGEPAAAGGHQHAHAHTYAGAHQHAHEHAEGTVWHSHGWGTAHAHRLELVTADRPKLPVLLALGIAGGLLPDPAALALLLAALSSGKVMLGLATVLVFSLGFAATLVVVGIIAAKVGERILQWLDSIWMVRVQILTTLLIIGMGVVLTIRAAYEIAQLPA